MPYNLADAIDRKRLADRIRDDIDDYCQRTYDDGHRTHLGASLIGKECSRELWYVFRWVYHHKFDGRMLRLFNRGHREELRFIEWMRGIGFQVWEQDENGKQFRVTDIGEHFGGSLDGLNTLPPHYGVTEPLLLTEFKTSGTGAGFNKVVDKGVRIGKPQHFAQMSIYGFKRGIKYSIYFMINKNDDSLHVEIVELDWTLGADLVRKAEAVISSQTPPPRIAANPTYFGCKFCDMKDVCWNGKPVEINCRSCKNARPVDNAEWHCDKFNAIIPKDYIKTGCPQHDPVS